MSEPSTPKQMIEELELLADHLQQVSARIGSAKRHSISAPSSTDKKSNHAPPSLRSRSSPISPSLDRQLRSSRKPSSPLGPASKSSSTRSSTSGVLNPEGRLRMALLQDRVAEEQKQRTLARIGELYLEQNKAKSMGSSQHSSEDGSEDLMQHTVKKMESRVRHNEIQICIWKMK
jgi:hypothetical protein